MRHKISLNVLIIGGCIVVGLLAKYFFSYFSINSLLFILQPTAYLVEFFTGLPFKYLTDQGFWNDSQQILIDKSCAGLNFWVISFFTAITVTVTFYKKITHKLLNIPITIILCYLLTIIANTSRIVIAIKLLPFNTSFPHLHALQGGFVYLFILILFYLTLQYLSKRYKTI